MSLARQILAVPVLLPTLLSAPMPAQEQLAWSGDLKAALQEGRASGRPVWVILVERSPDDRNLLLGLLREPQVQALAKECVRVVGCRAKHHRAQVADDPPRFRCEQFPALTCDQHEHVVGQVARRWPALRLGEEARPTPEHLLLSPDGDLLAHWGTIGRERLLAELELALRAALRGDRTRAAADEKRLAELTTALRAGRGIDRRVAFQSLMALPLQGARRTVFEHATDRQETRTRLEALAVVPMPGSYDALDVLERAAGDRNRRVQAVAIRGIGEIRLAGAVPFLLGWARRNERSEALLELPAALGLAAPGDPRTIAWLRQAMTSARNDLAKAAMLAVLVIHAPDPKLIETVREQIASKKDDVRETAALVLRELGKRPGGK